MPDPKNPLKHLYSTGRWQKFRRAYLAQHPLCVMCEQMGKVEAATVVDHKIPHRGDVVRFWVGPFQSLCAECHSGPKQAEEHGKVRGCDVNGWPLAEGGCK
jgi:5-methylcytosine-specific restriction enzyme A